MTKKNEETAVRNLQRYLRQLSYFDGQIKPPPIDGVFCPRTRAALLAFQRKEGLPETGTAGKETWDLLYRRYEESRCAHAAPVPVALFPVTSCDYAVKEGDRGFLVSAVRYLLGELSCADGDFRGVSRGEVYDGETARAVRLFQKKHCLPETGEVDRATWDALASVCNHTADAMKTQ